MYIYIRMHIDIERERARDQRKRSLGTGPSGSFFGTGITGFLCRGEVISKWITMDLSLVSLVMIGCLSFQM